MGFDVDATRFRYPVTKAVYDEFLEPVLPSHSSSLPALTTSSFAAAHRHSLLSLLVQDRLALLDALHAGTTALQAISASPLATFALSRPGDLRSHANEWAVRAAKEALSAISMINNRSTNKLNMLSNNDNDKYKKSEQQQPSPLIEGTYDHQGAKSMLASTSPSSPLSTSSLPHSGLQSAPPTSSAHNMHTQTALSRSILATAMASTALGFSELSLSAAATGTTLQSLPVLLASHASTVGLQLMSRGDPSLVLPVCTRVWNGRGLVSLSPEARSRIIDVWRQWDLKCLVVHGFAYAPIPSELAGPLLLEPDVITVPRTIPQHSKNNATTTVHSHTNNGSNIHVNSITHANTNTTTNTSAERDTAPNTSTSSSSAQRP